MIRRLQKMRRTPVSAADWFAARHRGGTDPALERAFEAWLADDPERQRQYALCEIAWDLARPAAERLRTPATENPGHIGTPHRRWAIGAGLAATVLVAVAALWLTLGSEPQPLRYATGPGEQRTVVLADGSRITLNTRTALSVTIPARQRNVVLENGEAFFDVAHDPSRPFHVLTPLGQVTVIGTRFNVYRRPDSLEVTTEQGLVRVSTAGRPDPTTDLLVHAGEGAAIPAPGAKPQLRHADLRRIENWRQQRLEFDAMPLAALLEEFSRYTAAPLHAATPEIGALRVSGVFHLGDITALSVTLDAAFGLKVRDSNDGSRVVERPKDAVPDPGLDEVVR